VNWIFLPFRLNGYFVGNSAEAKLPVDINLMTGDLTLLLNVVLHDYVQRLILVKYLLVDFAHEQFVVLVGHGNRIRQQLRRWPWPELIVRSV
jgi:hypothetical protein